MSIIAKTPTPPYYAVIFTSSRTADDREYDQTAKRLLELAKGQPGFLGVESARETLGITVSYWSDLESIAKWKANARHKAAQKKGREKWYQSFKARITKVERDYGR